MKPYHLVENISFSNDTMSIKIDGKFHNFKISEISARLKNASKADRENYRVSASGYGIHWPSIDEDLSIDGLLGIKHQPTFVDKVAS